MLVKPLEWTIDDPSIATRACSFDGSYTIEEDYDADSGYIAYFRSDSHKEGWVEGEGRVFHAYHGTVVGNSVDIYELKSMCEDMNQKRFDDFIRDWTVPILAVP